MKPVHAVAAALFLSFAALPAYSQQAKPSETTDAKAIRDLAQANMDEVEAGKFAQQKAQSDDVKKYAQHMVEDHSKILQEVQSLAQQKGVSLPKSPKGKDQARLKKLEQTSADKFDRVYMNEMVKGHQEDVKDIEKIAKKAKDPDVKAAAEKALLTMRKYVNESQQIAATTGGQAAAGSSGKASTTR